MDSFKGLRELALFAGAGGGILGGRLLDWTTVAAVEFDPYAASVLVARQNDGALPPFPVWDDVRTFEGRPWRGKIDVVSGGFPCQDISAAGKGAGISGSHSGLWSEFARVIREVRPRYAFVENSPMLVSRGLGRVLADMAQSGYDAAWLVLGADEVGAPHMRKRIWILAKDASLEKISDADGERGTAANFNPGDAREALASQTEEQPLRADCVRDGLPDAPHERALRRLRQLRLAEQTSRLRLDNRNGAPCYGVREWWSAEPRLGRVAHGVARRVDRLRCIGNGQVPLCAATAFRILHKIINEYK